MTLSAAEIDVGLMFALALAVSALGFVRIVYFVSLGYGFSMVAMAALAPFRWADALTLPSLLHCALLGLYGMRLSGYLVAREREPAYRKEVEEIAARNSGVALGKKVAIWLGVSLLYVCMFSPVLSHFLAVRRGESTPVTEWLGVVLMAGGLALEALADAQKAAYKREHPERFCDVKLYRLVRCPNYLGEVIFWVGNFTAAALALTGGWQWAGAVLGLVCIVLIMMGSTKRLEHKQDQRYGAREDYQQWVREVPVLFPLLPVYSLKGVKVYLE